MVLTPPTENDQDYSPYRSVAEAHNRGVLQGKFKKYTGTNANGQTITLAPPAQRILEVRYFDTSATIHDDAWVRLKQVSSLTAEALGYTYTEATGVILFGNGTDGYKPAAALLVEVEYDPKYVGESTIAPGYMRVQDGNGAVLADVVSGVSVNRDQGAVTTYATPPAVLTDTGKAWVVNEHAGRTVVITEGTGASQTNTAIVASNTANTMTMVAPFSVAPDTTSRYAIIETGLNGVVVAMPGITLNAEQVNIENIKGEEYRAVLPTLTSGQNSQVQGSLYGVQLVELVPNHGTGAKTFTYNADGTMNTWASTLNGKTFTRTATYNADGTIASSAMVVS